AVLFRVPNPPLWDRGTLPPLWKLRRTANSWPIVGDLCQRRRWFDERLTRPSGSRDSCSNCRGCDCITQFAHGERPCGLRTSDEIVRTWTVRKTEVLVAVDEMTSSRRISDFRLACI